MRSSRPQAMPSQRGGIIFQRQWICPHLWPGGQAKQYLYNHCPTGMISCIENCIDVMRLYSNLIYTDWNKYSAWPQSNPPGTQPQFMALSTWSCRRFYLHGPHVLQRGTSLPGGATNLNWLPNKASGSNRFWLTSLVNPDSPYIPVWLGIWVIIIILCSLTLLPSKMHGTIWRNQSVGELW